MTSQDAGLQLQWVDDITTLRTLMGEWEDLAERTRADVYLLPDWVSVWWDHFGQGRQLACMVLRHEDRLVGLLPFTIERLWIGPVPMRLARLAGTDPHCIVFQAPVEAEFAEFAWREALTHLLDGLRCTAVSLTPLSDRATHLPVLQGAIAADSRHTLEMADEGSHVIFALPKTFDEWLTRLSKKRRSQFRRDYQALQTEHESSEAAVAPDENQFTEFASFHAKQWSAVHKGGHFADWPHSLSFYRDLADRTPGDPLIRLHVLEGGTGPIATQFVLMAGKRAHWKLPARSLDPDIERLSPGKVGLIRMIASLIEDGVDLVEAGRGEYGYKLSYGGEGVPVWRALISRNTACRKLQMRLLLAWADLLNLVYYRIWFHKIAPRLRRLTGARPRPLWRGWIRTRV